MKFFVFVLCLLFCPHLHAWELHKNKDNVEIYKRVNASGIFEVKAVTQVDASVLSLLNLLNDTQASVKWIARCHQVDVIEWLGNDERIVHSYFSSPWPLKDRDMVTLSRTYLSDNAKKLTIEISDRGQQYPLLANYTRMQNINGLWTVEKLADGKVEIIYSGSGEPGGLVPELFSNRLLVNSAFTTFTNMRKWVQLAQYQ